MSTSGDRDSKESASRSGGGLSGHVGRADHGAPWSPWVTEGPRDAEPSLSVGHKWQLLVDTHLLADWWNVVRVQEPVTKCDANPIIQPDLSWEQRHTYGGFPTGAMYDKQDGRFKIWYHHTLVSGGKVTGLAYSNDGVTWNKPDLNLVEVAGQRRNNVCRLEPIGVPVWQDICLVQNLPDDRTPQRRLLAVGISPFASDGLRINGWRSGGYSADGLTWHLLPGGERAGAGGGNLACIWDDDLEQYVLFQRQLTECAGTGGGRYIARQTSTDLRHWSPRVTVFNPMDPKWPEVESMMAFRHEGIYFGLPQMLENRRRRELEVHLAISRDGIHWEHPFPDRAFIPRGPDGSFDDTTTWFAQTVVRPDRIHFFYAGGRLRHGDRAQTADDGLKIGSASVPINRLIGLHAGDDAGALLTRPILVEGKDLYLNAAVAPGGELRVEVIDPVVHYRVDKEEGESWGYMANAQTRIYPGYAMADCEVVKGDFLRRQVGWRGVSLGSLTGRPVRLRFEMRRATVYGFQIS